MDNVINLNFAQRLQAMQIFAHGVREATLHISKLCIGGHLYARAGTGIDLPRAIKRRRRCMQLFKQARRGFLIKE